MRNRTSLQNYKTLTTSPQTLHTIHNVDDIKLTKLSSLIRDKYLLCLLLDHQLFFRLKLTFQVFDNNVGIEMFYNVNI